MIEWAMGWFRSKISIFEVLYHFTMIIKQSHVISQHTPKHNSPHYQFYKSDDFEFNSMNSWKICTWLKLAGFMKIDFGRCWIVCRFLFAGNYGDYYVSFLSFLATFKQTVKILLFKLSKFSFSNCQNSPF
jgi:hypothetical protein